MNTRANVKVCAVRKILRAENVYTSRASYSQLPEIVANFKREASCRKREVRMDRRQDSDWWRRRPLAGRQWVGALMVIAVLLASCAGQSVSAAPDAPIPQDIPPLPFVDNPDPTLCGIPQPDGRQGVVTGEYEGEIIQPIVYLYASHLRASIVGQVFPETEVEIKLSQSNPSLDYYYVETINVEPAQKGWIPAPFLEINS